MLKILLLEDEKPQADRFMGFLARYQTDHPDFIYALKTYDRGVELLEAYHRDADLVFLDIRVPDMLGMEVAKKLRAMDESVMLVFVTNLTQYAIDGYSVGAFDYILKSLHYASFSAKLQRALRVLAARERDVILDLRTREGARRLSAGSVTYIEVSAHDLLFHTGGEVLRQWGTLAQYEEQLSGASFARPSASFLVNLKYVEGIQKDRVLVNGDALPISRSKRKDFLSTLAQYKGGTA